MSQQYQQSSFRHSLQASRLNLPAKIDSSRALDDQYFLQLLAKIFDQELVVLINWAKAIPGSISTPSSSAVGRSLVKLGYTESLTLDQQVNDHRTKLVGYSHPRYHRTVVGSS